MRLWTPHRIPLPGQESQPQNAGTCPQAYRPAQPKAPTSEKADGRLWCGIGVRELERVRPPGSCLLLPKHIDLLQRHLSAFLACRVLVVNQIRWASLGSAGEGAQAHSGTLAGGSGPVVLRVLKGTG